MDLMERSIPAGAGEPNRGSGQNQGARVNPRVRGGTLLGIDPALNDQGRSPRLRGNLLTTKPILGSRENGSRSGPQEKHSIAKCTMTSNPMPQQGGKSLRVTHGEFPAKERLGAR